MDMRIEQPKGKRGSLKWIQQAVNEQWPSLTQPIAAGVRNGGTVDWLSPLATDGFAEYRDATALDKLGHPSLANALRISGRTEARSGMRWAARRAETCC
jgi:hypothetical protein